MNLVPGLGGQAPLAELTVGQRLLYMPLLLLVYSLLLGISLIPANSSLATMMQLAVPDLKRGRVGSALNTLTTSAGLLSMAAAAAAGEVVPLRAINVFAGATTSLAGLVGILVHEEPVAPVDPITSEGPWPD